MRPRGRPVLGAISGLFFGVFLAADLVFTKVVALDSVVITILPVAGLVLGIVLGRWAPFRRGRVAGTEAAPSAAEPEPAPEPAPEAVEPPPAEPESDPTLTASDGDTGDTGDTGDSDDAGDAGTEEPESTGAPS